MSKQTLIDTYYIIRPEGIKSWESTVVVLRFQIETILRKEGFKRVTRELLAARNTPKLLLGRRDRSLNLLKPRKRGKGDRWHLIAYHFLRVLNTKPQSVLHEGLEFVYTRRLPSQRLVEVMCEALKCYMLEEAGVNVVLDDFRVSRGILKYAGKKIVKALCNRKGCESRLDQEDLRLVYAAVKKGYNFLPAPSKRDCANCLWNNARSILEEL